MHGRGTGPGGRAAPGGTAARGPAGAGTGPGAGGRAARRGDEPGHRRRVRPAAHRGPRPAAARGAPGLGGLSARERELVTLVAQGRTDAQIAAQLYISVRTVRSHLDRIRDKTGCRRRADLTRLALTAGPGLAAGPPAPASRPGPRGSFYPAAAQPRKRGHLIPARRLPGRENLPGEGPKAGPGPPARETIMYAYRHPEIARHRIAELHHQALLDTVAIALRRARRGPVRACHARPPGPRRAPHARPGPHARLPPGRLQRRLTHPARNPTAGRTGQAHAKTPAAC